MLSHFMILKQQENNLKLNNSKHKKGLTVTSAVLLFFIAFSVGCKKEETPKPKPTPNDVQLVSIKWDDNNVYGIRKNASVNPIIRIRFSEPLDTAVALEEIGIKYNGVQTVKCNYSFENGDSTIVFSPVQNLKYYSKYTLPISTQIKSKVGGGVTSAASILIRTTFDPSQKFPTLTEDQLLDLVQEKTFGYFWDFAHPVSGLSRERNTSGDLVTSGGSGFGIMAAVAATERNFISRSELVQHMDKMTDFLWNTADVFHGAFSHWLSGSTGEVRPFSANDDGADLVETSYLIMGLLTAKEYLDINNPDEKSVIDRIDSIWYRVDWNWFTKNGAENQLYWHWSPNKGWAMNMPIRGYNECLITHVLAASSPTYPVDPKVYHTGWARNGGMKNGKSFYGITLPLGEDYGGPLFFEQYTYLGLDPRGLTDNYANYWDQVVNHSKINHAYCKANPKNQAGYSDSCWGLTASDNPWGYSAHSPTNDRGVITPTAALSSIPYSPEESKKALNFFYYIMGDLLFKDYGFVDAFCVGEVWAASSFLAIDQGPIIVNIENYRSQLLWELFTANTDIQTGLKALNFQAPYLK